VTGDNLPTEMQISEGELTAMTAQLDDMHTDSMTQVRQNMAGVTDRIASATRTVASRRIFLLGGAAAVGSVALAACGSSSSGSGGSSPSGGGTSNGASPYTGDLKVVALAAALENLAVAGYGLVLKSAGKGKYGKVPQAIATFATTVQKQHADHAKEWNSVLKGAGVPQITGTPLTIASGAVASLQGAKTIPAVANIALGLENAAAETYVFAAANVSDPGGIATAATIAPVEAMHAAILSFVLGKYPVPNADIGITMAVQPSALTA
jgi:hypothetical protein